MLQYFLKCWNNNFLVLPPAAYSVRTASGARGHGAAAAAGRARGGRRHQGLGFAILGSLMAGV
jgi:hypothetical protein